MLNRIIPYSNMHKLLTLLGLSLMITFGYQFIQERSGRNDVKMQFYCYELAKEHFNVNEENKTNIHAQIRLRRSLDSIYDRLEQQLNSTNETNVKLMRNALKVDFENLKSLNDNHLTLAHQNAQQAQWLKILNENDLTELFTDRTRNELNKKRKRNKYLQAFGCLAGLAVFLFGAKIWRRNRHIYQPR